MVTRRTDIQRCVDCKSGYLVCLEKEVIFNKFVGGLKSEGVSMEVRYNPFTGFKPISENKAKQHQIVPGDPDMIPPKTKENVAEIINTAGHR